MTSGGPCCSTGATGWARRPSAALVALLVGALLPLSPAAGAATVDPPGARAVTDACPAGDVPGHGFTDVAAGDVHEAAIACLAWYGVTSGGPAGLGPTEYGPDLTVRRDQMASFIVRLIDHANPGALRTDVTGNTFPCPSDPASALPADNVHYSAVRRLSAADIVAGGPAGAPAACYGPDLMVTRAQMASLLDRALEFLTLRSLTSSTDFYDDDGIPHEPSIEAITEVGIAQGSGARRYGPGAPVRRDSMASFLVRSLEFLVDNTLAFPPGAVRPEPGQALVALDESSVAAGGEVTGVITGADVVLAIVSGCGFDNQPVDDIAGEVPGIQFASVLPDDQPEGVCTLIFTTSFRHGVFDADRISITVGPVPANSATITLDNDVVEAGELLSGEITGAAIDAASVSGCGLAGEALPDVGVPEFFRFEVLIPANQSQGDCQLTFVTIFAGGASDTDVVTVRVR